MSSTTSVKVTTEQGVVTATRIFAETSRTRVYRLDVDGVKVGTLEATGRSRFRTWIDAAPADCKVSTYSGTLERAAVEVALTGLDWKRLVDARAEAAAPVSAATNPAVVIRDVEDADYFLTVREHESSYHLAEVTALLGDLDDVETHVSVVVNRAAVLRALLPSDVLAYVAALINMDADGGGSIDDDATIDLAADLFCEPLKGVAG